MLFVVSPTSALFACDVVVDDDDVDVVTIGKSSSESSIVDGSSTSATYDFQRELLEASIVNRTFLGTKCIPSPLRGFVLLSFFPLPCQIRPL